MNTTIYQLAWWDEHPWPAGEAHWVRLPHPYESEDGALTDLGVYHGDYPDQDFAVFRVTSELVTRVKGRAAA